MIAVLGKLVRTAHALVQVIQLGVTLIIDVSVVLVKRWTMDNVHVCLGLFPMVFMHVNVVEGRVGIPVMKSVNAILIVMVPSMAGGGIAKIRKEKRKSRDRHGFSKKTNTLLFVFFQIQGVWHHTCPVKNKGGEYFQRS